MKALALIVMGILASQMLVAGEGTDRTAAMSQTVEQGTTSAAERYLFDLALASKKARSMGYVLLITGTVAAAGGVAVLTSVDDDEDLDGFFEALGGFALLSSGVAMMGGGLGAALIASGPERRYAVVKSIPDPLERERASREALADLARSGRTKRYVLGGLMAAAAVYSLVSTSDPQSALVPGGFAVFQLLTRSREERTYARFLAQDGPPPGSLNLGFGLGPRGGFRLALTASF